MFGDDVVVASPESAKRRNQFVTALATAVLVPYAVPGGKVEHETNQAISRGQTVLTFDDDQNARLIARGARPITAGGMFRPHVGLPSEQ